MYVPESFREDEPGKLREVMRSSSFATLVTQGEGAPFASHLPFLLEEKPGPHGTLRGHMARANPQWRAFRDGAEALVIFQGPHAYISPSWYENRQAVPTWNYIAVHAYGVPRMIDDSDDLLALLRSTVATYEAPLERPWPFDLPEEFTRNLMRAIVGFEIPISRLEGKFKLSQNRPAEDRRGVIAALHRLGDPSSAEVAARMSGEGATEEET